MERLAIWNDPQPRAGALQMALDEALLTAGRLACPLLRHYRWAGRAATLGFSTPLGEARREAPGFDLVRRWTGGGVVRHDADWTFSLIVPSHHPLAEMRPRDSYCAIHQAVAAALELRGIPVRLAGPGEELPSASCFRGVSPHDALDAAGRKICGGAQRRCRHGLLHQGSLQGVAVPEDFVRLLASRLAQEVEPYAAPAAILACAEALALERYGSEEWLERRL